MNNWLTGSSVYIDLMCYCSHRFKEAWKQKAIFRAGLFARVKSCIFTCKDFLMSMSFPLNPKTSPLRGRSPDQWRCFCASDCGQQGLWTTGLSWPGQSVCLEKTCCPCSFTNAESRWQLKPVPGKTGRNPWCCCVVGDQWLSWVHSDSLRLSRAMDPDIANHRLESLILDPDDGHIVSPQVLQRVTEFSSLY